MKIQQLTRLDIAKKKVNQMKDFYIHLAIYIILNIVVFLGQGKTIFTLFGKQVFGNLEFLETFNWDVYGTPMVWGVLLLFHAVKVFSKRRFLNEDWEKRLVVRYMEEERSSKK